jgi:hypothetical protein
LAPANGLKAIANDSKAIANGPKAVANESKAIANDPKAIANESKAIANESKAVANKSLAPADEPKAAPPGAVFGPEARSAEAYTIYGIGGAETMLYIGGVEFAAE